MSEPRFDAFTMEMLRAAREFGERLERQRVLEYLRKYVGVADVVRDLEHGEHDGGRRLAPVDLELDSDDIPPTEGSPDAQRS